MTAENIETQFAPKYTPGPWKVVDDIYNGLITVRSNDNKYVCSVCRHLEITKDRIADANLIAAAPKMLEALRSIANNTCCGSCQEAALVARAVIAEAEGHP